MWLPVSYYSASSAFNRYITCAMWTARDWPFKLKSGPQVTSYIFTLPVILT